jgi:hypothetical protein
VTSRENNETPSPTRIFAAESIPRVARPLAPCPSVLHQPRRSNSGANRWTQRQTVT